MIRRVVPDQVDLGEELCFGVEAGGFPPSFYTFAAEAAEVAGKQAARSGVDRSTLESGWKREMDTGLWWGILAFLGEAEARRCWEDGVLGAGGRAG